MIVEYIPKLQHQVYSTYTFWQNALCSLQSYVTDHNGTVDVYNVDHIRECAVLSEETNEFKGVHIIFIVLFN